MKHVSYLCYTFKNLEITIRFSYICAWLPLSRSGIHWHHELKRFNFYSDWLEVLNWISNDWWETNKLQKFSSSVLLQKCDEMKCILTLPIQRNRNLVPKWKKSTGIIAYNTTLRFVRVWWYPVCVITSLKNADWE